MNDDTSTAGPTTGPATARVILSAADIDRALTRIAHEILESNKGSSDLVLLGIPRRGYPLARRIAEKIAATDPDFDPAAGTGAWISVSHWRQAHFPRTCCSTVNTPGV